MKNLFLILFLVTLSLKNFSQEAQEIPCTNELYGDFHIRMVDCNNSITITNTTTNSIAKGTITSLQEVKISPINGFSIKISPPPNTNIDIKEPYSTRIAVVQNIQYKDYYVSTTGSDSNVGTIVNPFLTIKKARSKVKPGDNVYIRGGTYRERFEQNLDPTNSGKPGNYITYQNYNNEEVIIKGSIIAESQNNNDTWILYSNNIWKFNGTWPRNPQQVFYTNTSGESIMLNKMGLPNNFNDWVKDSNDNIICTPPTPDDGNPSNNTYIPFPLNNNSTSLPNGMWAGTFYYDDNGFDYSTTCNENNYVTLQSYTTNYVETHVDLQGTLYIKLPNNENPNNHLVEISHLRDLWAFSKKKYIKLKGLTFMHTNSNHYGKQRSAVSLGPFSIVENCTFAYCDFVGLHLSGGQQLEYNIVMNEDETTTNIIGNTGQIVRNSVFHNNGASGLGANKTGGFLVENCEFYNNANRPFYTNWASAAMKIIPFSWGTVKNNNIHDEYAHGIWFDGANSENPITISHNKLENIGYKPNEEIWNTVKNDSTRLHPHRGMGIFIELTNYATIYNNIIKDVFRRGIYLASSSDNKIANNLIIGTEERGQIGINYTLRVIEGLNGTVDLYTKNNEIYNNILFEKKLSTTRDIEIFGVKFDPVNIDNTIIDYNLFYNSNDEYYYQKQNNSFNNLEDWHNATGFDKHSLDQQNPLFVSSNTGNWQLTNLSPAIDIGETLSYVSDDIIFVTRPQGISFDIGPYEYVSSSSKSTSNPNEENIPTLKKEKIINISVYPNPVVNNQVNIKINNNNAKISLVKIIDTNGKIVKIYYKDLNTSIDISTISSGFYIMNIQLTNGEVLQKKIIIK